MGVVFGDFIFKNRIVILKWGRLGHTPPAQNASELLVKEGFPVTCVEFGGIDEPVAFLRRQVPRLRLACGWARHMPRPLRAISIICNAFAFLTVSFLKHGKPALIIAEGVTEQFLCVWFKRLLGISYAVQVHEAFEPWELSGFMKMLFRWEGAALREASFLTFPHETRREIYRARYKFDVPSFLVFNTPRKIMKIERANLQRRFHIDKKSFLVGYVGGIGKSNAPELAIEALTGVSNAHLILWGWGDENYLAELRDLAGRLHVTDRTHFAGVLNEGKWKSIAGLDVSYCVYRPDALRFKYPTTASNKLMESLALGVPVITTNTPEFQNIVVKNKIGLCIPNLDSRSIVETLSQIQNDELGRKRMATNGIKLHRAKWNYEHQFAPVIKHMKTLLPDLLPRPVSRRKRAR